MKIKFLYIVIFNIEFSRFFWVNSGVTFPPRLMPFLMILSVTVFLCLVTQQMPVLKIFHFLFFLAALILTIVNIHERYFTLKVLIYFS